MKNLKDFARHVLRLFLFIHKYNQLKELKETNIARGVHITFYKWFKKTDILLLGGSKLPNKVNWFTIISWKAVNRTPRRKVVRNVLGKSKAKILNEHKMAALAYIKKINEN